MNIHARVLAFAIGLIGFADAASAAAVIKSQPPCAGPSGYCLRFDAGTAIPVIRSIDFTAPSKGTAAVSFNGSLVCSNGAIADKVVDVVTQIVPGPSVVPAVNGPGAKRLATVLKDSPEHALSTTDSFDLASMRVFAIPAAGLKTFYFKIASLRMDTTTYCLVYNATFTVQFVP